ncbi:MAG: Mov34/MPN/PAD-1 family protein, partial [Planctomycetota bacterium]
MIVRAFGGAGPGPALARRLADLAERTAPHECCGLVLRAVGGTETLHPCRNTAADPRTGFALHPGDLAAALALVDAGATLVAVYHSHPRGPARLSPADR